MEYFAFFISPSKGQKQLFSYTIILHGVPYNADQLKRNSSLKFLHYQDFSRISSFFLSFCRISSNITRKNIFLLKVATFFHAGILCFQQIAIFTKKAKDMTAGIKSPPILTFHNPLHLVNSAFLGNHQPHTTMQWGKALYKLVLAFLIHA